ncbi:MAG: diacylglycerol kinase family protein, partial [Rhodococcus sp.]|nr:diacylglycerol kinase family protein [Rhodococcus sp. (in: high G+C Gram-positive bacteria)]
MTTSAHTDRPSSKQSWLARAAFAALVLAVAVLLIFAGLKTLTMLILGIGGVVVCVVAVYWFLTTRGFLRWLSLAVAVLTPIVVLTFLVRERLLWVVLLAIGLFVVAGIFARTALAGEEKELPVVERTAPPPVKPFFVMNPNSGGGKVEKFDLKRKAEERGATVALLEGPEKIDVTALSRQAVADGADLLGVAGGDGTQALVAAVAAEHDLPFLVVSAGTRNHFAADLGLDLEDPSRCLDALVDGVEVTVDLGNVGGRTFVNNASFGAYAEVVQSPEYRDAKTSTFLQMLPDLLAGRAGAVLTARSPSVSAVGPQAVLVSNGPYEMNDLAGLGHRPRLDRGTLGIVAISVSSARQAIGLLHRAHQHGLAQGTGFEVIVDADTDEIPVGVDGEALVMPTPVRCTVSP